MLVKISSFLENVFNNYYFEYFASIDFFNFLFKLRKILYEK